MIIILPMAGRGSRFSNTGVETPKPFIDVLGKPMIWWALQSLKGLSYSKLIVVALAEHENRFGVEQIFHNIGYTDVEFIFLDDVTDGQLCTVLTARDIISSREDVLIANSDTYIVSSLDRDINSKSDNCAGIISVTEVPGDQWSFARVDGTGKVIEVAEKTRISDYVSTGFYYFSSGSEFLKVADTIIQFGEKTKGEYYVIPVYQKMIEKGNMVGISNCKEMWDLGTPESLEYFINHFAEKKELT